jgi:hypothetical protein
MGMKQMRGQRWRNAYLVIYERKNQSYQIVNEDEEMKEKEETKA